MYLLVSSCFRCLHGIRHHRPHAAKNQSQSSLPHTLSLTHTHLPFSLLVVHSTQQKTSQYRTFPKLVQNIFFSLDLTLRCHCQIWKKRDKEQGPSDMPTQPHLQRGSPFAMLELYSHTKHHKQQRQLPQQRQQWQTCTNNVVPV